MTIETLCYSAFQSALGYLRITKWQLAGSLNLNKNAGCVPSAAVVVSVCPGGCLPRRMSAQGGVCPGGCLPRGVCPGRGCWVSAQGIYQTPPLWTEWQTDVKTLPCRNYVANGNNDLLQFLSSDLKLTSPCTWELVSLKELVLKSPVCHANLWLGAGIVRTE